MTMSHISKTSTDAWLDAARRIAREAGSLIKQLAKTGPEVKHKGPLDIVTSADLEAEEYITSELLKQFPNHGILGEEGGGDADADILWVIDPIDGTTNYAHGFPVFAVSIAVMINHESMAGAVYEPNLDEMFTAVHGEGAFLNGESISVSATDDFDKALVGTGFPYSLRNNPQPIMEDFTRVLLSCQGVRRAGAASVDLCNLACGRLDAFWERELKPWDTAAAALVAREAGAELSRFDGTRFDHFFPEIAAANGSLHKELLSLLSASR